MGRTILILMLAFCVAFGPPVQADKTATSGSNSSVNETPTASAKSEQGKGAPRKKEPPKLTSEREAAALTFVRKNHADLEELLYYLKENLPQEYRKAVYDLYRTSERLAQYQDRGDMERYELELQLWQAQSRIRLIAARLQMNDSKELRAELKSTLNEQLALQRSLLTLDRNKLADRLEKLDEQIRRLNDDREDEIGRQIRLLTRPIKDTNGRSPPRSARDSGATDRPQETPAKTVTKN